MKIFKKALLIIISILIITTTLIGSDIKRNSIFVKQEIVKAAVIVNSFDNEYMVLMREQLKQIQEANVGKIEFTFFDANGNQDNQNQIIDSAIKNNYDVLMINLVDVSTGVVDTVIDRIKISGIPVAFFNIEPFIRDSIKSYGKAVIVASDAEQSGTLQGEIIIDEWNKNNNAVDRNKDNALQYIMLAFSEDNTLSVARANYSIAAIRNAGITPAPIDLKTSDGSEEESRKVIQPLLLTYGDRIEAIIASNDTMAIGAIQALQAYGYNSGVQSRQIIVVGGNGVPEALELINNGFMTGTVIQDAPEMAKALYSIGINLALDKNPLEGTTYKFDETGITIRLPYTKYIKANNQN
jgi:methyl-galactoside transport system substrate-binding protein